MEASLGLSCDRSNPLGLALGLAVVELVHSVGFGHGLAVKRPKTNPSRKASVRSFPSQDVPTPWRGICEAVSSNLEATA